MLNKQYQVGGVGLGATVGLDSVITPSVMGGKRQQIRLLAHFLVLWRTRAATFQAFNAVKPAILGEFSW
jgi:hypothetical protein